MNFNHLGAALCILILAGCATGNRYQLSRDEAGRLIRLDTQTGEVMLVEGDKLTPFKETGITAAKTESKDEEIPQVELPDGGKSWPTLTIPELGNASAELTSYWYNGKMRYVLELYPLSKRLKLVYGGYYTNPTFSLAMKNAAGKQVVWTALSGNRLKHTINKKRKVEELSGEGVVVMTKGEYDSLANWHLRWSP
jgi:hypothetical protein